MAIIVLKGILGIDEDHSVIRGIEAFQRIGTGSKTFKFHLEPDEVFEAALLGHSHVILDQGPLTVAALGWNPPERSIHFHLSLLSLSGDSVDPPSVLPTPPEFKVIELQLEKLNTKYLTLLIGEGLDHALVREYGIEIRTTRPSEISRSDFRMSLPEGDGENELRRFVDDSVNLLAEREFNLRRIDQGIAPINLCWPWGQGVRQRIPNRALAIGYPWLIRANSLATRGLARLSGFRPEKLSLWSHLDFRDLLTVVQRDSQAMTVIDVPAPPVDEKGREEFGDRIRDFGTQLIEPLLEWRLDSKSALSFVATNRAREGIVAFCRKENERDLFPFDERSLTEKQVNEFSLTQLLDLAL